MAINTIRCPVLDANVTKITDLEGITMRIICSEYNERDGSCRLKKSASEGGLLSQLLARVDEATLHTRNPVCVLLVA